MRTEIERQNQLKKACHELRAVQTAVQTGIQCLQNPSVKSEAAASLCAQGLARLEKILTELESSLSDSVESEGKLRL